MSTEQAVSKTYLHGGLLAAIEAALARMGKPISSLSIADLAPVDEFHIGGRVATERFMKQLNLNQDSQVLDVGCGLGGSARFVANAYQSQVTGIDLSREYIETGNTLCEWVKLKKQIALQHGSALDMPFDNDAFNRAYMLHVGMNIEDKTQIFTELYRVLRPGAILGIYDVMRQQQGDLTFPVPWATSPSTSYLATPDEYCQALSETGFELVNQSNRRDFAIEFFNQLGAKTQAKGGPPPLGLHTLMQESTSAKISNMIANIENNLIVPVELIAQKT
ncbi:MAG: class I SAM-dependent methyltransferase [Proteobacteria bacterium]|nr:class I SAM-dependent methyltransferase [Pseudomonadota bacterium]